MITLLRWRSSGAVMPGLVLAATLLVAWSIGWLIAEGYWRTLVVAALFGLGPIALRWPIAAFGLYAFLVPFESVTLVADTGGATVTKLVGVMAAGAMLASGVVQRRLVRPPAVALWICVLSGWALVTVIWAVDLDRSRGQMLTGLSLVAMYLAAVSFNISEKELKGACFLAMIGGVFAALAIALFGFEADATRAARGTLALADKEANANGAAQSLILPLGFAIATMLTARRLAAQLFAVASIAVIATGIFLTVSRASLAAIILMICVLLYRFRVRSRLIVVLAILAALIPFMPEVFFDRIGRVFSGEDATGSGRTGIWAIGLDALGRFGLFGAGFANFPAAYNIFSHTDSSRGAHNEFLGTWVELGVVGLGVFVVALVAHVRAAKGRNGAESVRSFSAVVEATGFGFMLIAFFSDVLLRKPFWLSWIFAVWAGRLATRSSDVSAPHVPSVSKDSLHGDTQSRHRTVGVSAGLGRF